MRNSNIGAAFLICSAVQLLFTTTAAIAVDTPAADGAKSEKTAPSLAAPNLRQLASDYRSAPDELSWARYGTYLRDLLALPQYVNAESSQIIAANPSLGEFKVKVTDCGIANFRIWSFPRINESHAVVFQTPARTTAIPLPQSVAFREARIVGGVVAAAIPAPASGKAKGKVHAHSAPHKLPHPVAHVVHAGGGPKALVLIGADRNTSTLWFKGFQLVEGMPEATELFSALPAFFTQNVTGKASFSGNDIVLTIQQPVTPKKEVEEEKPAGTVKDTITKRPVTGAPSAGYKVILKFIGSRYALSGHMADDAPLSVALSFSQAIAAAKPDLAKSWLVDPKLVSVPKYLGLFGRVSPPMRLVTMSASQGGAARYRLVTSSKDDLIIEVARIMSSGRLKGQLAIRALFVAPPDPIARNLSGTMVLPPGASPVSSSSSGGSEKPGASLATPARKN